MKEKVRNARWEVLEVFGRVKRTFLNDWLVKFSVACVVGDLRRFKKERKSDEGEGVWSFPSFSPRPLPFVAFLLFLEST